MSDYLNGIDVSEHQGVIDWEKLKDQIDFAVIRAGYGKNNIDGQFVRNITECNRLGIPCGVYWFSYAWTAGMAKAEAAYCLAAVEPYELEYPVCFDFEYDSVNYAAKNGATVTKTLASAMTAAFCEAVEAAGYYAMNYANSDYLSRYFDSDTAARFDLWLASWPNTPDFDKPPRTCGIWQWGGKTYDGVSGYVDSNVAYKDYAQTIRGWGLNRLAAADGTRADERRFSIWLTQANAETLSAFLNEKGISAKLTEVTE